MRMYLYIYFTTFIFTLSCLFVVITTVMITYACLFICLLFFFSLTLMYNVKINHKKYLANFRYTIGIRQAHSMLNKN